MLCSSEGNIFLNFPSLDSHQSLDIFLSPTHPRTFFTGRRLTKESPGGPNVFRHFDRDRSGSIDGRELAEALRSFGYNLSPPLLTLIEHKYASEPDMRYGPPPGITFDRFVRACVAVKTLTEAFQRVDTDNDGWVQLSYEQFMSVRYAFISTHSVCISKIQNH
ncbi:putative EF-hand domain containing protein [Lyophyllum shimeji]|uniref:EF-hand domain containing protein n=1 Tax=Lyophyllum shimeji TaxID=47721 RepID=A0A9P3PGK5_LYOSH|nr:putative EF-hand domain containing protein [Lyophyllum shimeji]